MIYRSACTEAHAISSLSLDTRIIRQIRLRAPHPDHSRNQRLEALLTLIL